MTTTWIRAGALLIPPREYDAAAALAAMVHARPDEVVQEVDGGRYHGWWALPRNVRVTRKITERSVLPPAPLRRLKVPLRPYQRAAVKAWRAAGEGTIVLPCGGGKTTTGLACIAETATPALILVHRWDLATQWIERAADQLGVVAELVRGPDTRARLAIATFQALAAWSAEDRAALGARYGLVVIDEAHHVPAATWSAVLADLPGRHRLALTATPERADEKTPLLYAHCGRVVHEVQVSELEALGATLAPLVLTVPTRWRAPKGDDAGAAMVDATGRNRKVVELVKDAAAGGRRILVLVDRVAHAEALATKLRRAGVRADHVVGVLGATDRAQRLDGLRYGSLDALVATSVADEGLDLPEIDTVVLASPSAAIARVQQRIGRALRPRAGKQSPIVYDLVDSGENADRAFAARADLYRELGWTVEAAATSAKPAVNAEKKSSATPAKPAGKATKTPVRR